MGARLGLAPAATARSPARLRASLDALASAVLPALLGACSSFPVGDVNHRYVVRGPSVDEPGIGRSKSFPAALRIPVDPHAHGPLAGVGKVAYEALFSTPEYAPFVFNVAFASARTDLCGHSEYANPRSIWFNVFFGFYEIDAPKSKWKRPFGYKLTERGPEVAFEDVVRLGKADWNYFSNHVYGVPADAIRPLDVVDMNAVTTRRNERERIGGRYWDSVELSGITVVSPYVARDGSKKLQDVFPVLSPLWRSVFGVSKPDDAFPTSFFPTRLRAKIFMTYTEERDASVGEDVYYKTFFFGAVVNEGYVDKAANERFLDLQVRSLREVIRRDDSTLGFAAPR